MHFATLDLDGERGKALANLAGIKHRDAPSSSSSLSTAWRDKLQHGGRGEDCTSTSAHAVVPVSTFTISPCAAVDRKSTRLNSSHSQISYAVFCLKKKKKKYNDHF